jgi:hypothetical protein
MSDIVHHNRLSEENGSSRVTVILGVVLVVMMGFVVRGLVPGDAPAPAPTPESAVANASIAEQQNARAEEVRRTLEQAAADYRADVGYGPPQPPKPVDRQTVSRLEALLADAENLVRRGRSEAMRIPEASVDAGLRTDAARRATASWDTWSRSWSARVDDFGRRLARQGGAIGLDQPEYMAYQDLTFLVNDLNVIPMSYGTTTNIPLLSERESKFDSADWRIGEAKQKLWDLRKSLPGATSLRD